MGVERVGISLDADLLKKYDALIKEKGYENRSESIRDLIRDALVKASTESSAGRVVGTLTITYDHDEGGVTEKLLEIQHHHHQEIISTLHVHIDEHTCLEVLVLRGITKDVRSLADRIRAIKGVRYGEIVLISTTV